MKVMTPIMTMKYNKYTSGLYGSEKCIQQFNTISSSKMYNNKVLLLPVTSFVIIVVVALYSWRDYDVISRSLLHSNNNGMDELYILNRHSVDIISVGSLLKEAFQDAQQRTFGNHYTVRTFYRITERNDADQKCYTGLTTDELQETINFCTNTTIQKNNIVQTIRQRIFDPKKNTGWLCAQKRPIDGLYYVLQQYKEQYHTITSTLNSTDSTKTSFMNQMNNILPKYLYIIDDDTYISNMDHLLETLLTNFPHNTAQVIAGCNFFFLYKQKMTFPFGGYGTFLSRTSIERLLRPIHCNYNNKGKNNPTTQKDDPFLRLTCWRIHENSMGEQLFFRDGMSIIDLMYEFSKQQPFGNVQKWKPNAGYCFHSDHALAYFFNMYHIAVPDSVLTAEGFKYSDQYRKTYKYTALHSEYKDSMHEGECMNNHPTNCTVNTTICHYIKPNDMINMYRRRV